MSRARVFCTPSRHVADLCRSLCPSRRNNFVLAHDVYTRGCSQRGLDYPEYLLEAWLSFEKQHGSLADLEAATMKIKRQKKGLEKKRAREMLQQMQAQAAQAQAAQGQEQAASTFIDHAVASGSAANEKKREHSALQDGDEVMLAVEGGEQASKRARTSDAIATSAPAASTSTAAPASVATPASAPNADEGPKR